MSGRRPEDISVAVSLQEMDVKQAFMIQAEAAFDDLVQCVLAGEEPKSGQPAVELFLDPFRIEQIKEKYRGR